MDMNVIFESENIIYVRPSFDLVPQYLEMVNDIENVAKFIGERRTLLTEQEEIDYIKDKMDKEMDQKKGIKDYKMLVDHLRKEWGK